MWRVSAIIAALSVISAAQAQQLNDPTAPPQVTQTTTPGAMTHDLRLQAVQRRPEGIVAYINGQRLQEGDTLPPYAITKITMNQVVVRHQQTGAEMTLFIFGDALGSGGQE
ncbi:hypothetical protein [Pseudidiomarina insulisalsae]|uniref:MSHA biogenesis protein MshK n=1 Tax=Pseudidiomarina insulisalsae TaxID=575789 RepID=A0A432YN57_9GAMM|nr:hypothetical protein [Pseudidiomarina insulisalsae]RUO62421.1 hypothetical protein CWI71_02995 [Pseudidiomarina insulisalsae]